MQNNKISPLKRWKKTFQRQNDFKKKKTENAIPTESDRKATNFGLKLSNGTPKFPYKFKEIIS